MIKGYHPDYNHAAGTIVHVDGGYMFVVPDGRVDAIELMHSEIFVLVRHAKYMNWPDRPKEPWIMAAACLKNGRLWTGRRHGTLIKQMGEDGHAAPGDPAKLCHQGFVDRDYWFYSRKDAARIAFDRGQLKKQTDTCPDSIFSEDLW
jgi:hypothetical protein